MLVWQLLFHAQLNSCRYAPRSRQWLLSARCVYNNHMSDGQSCRNKTPSCNKPDLSFNSLTLTISSQSCKSPPLKTSPLLNPRQGKFVESFLQPQLNHASLFSLLPYILQPYCLHSKAVPTQLEDKPSLSADKVWRHWLLHPLFISLCLLGCQRLLATAGRWIVLHHSTLSWCPRRL